MTHLAAAPPLVIAHRGASQVAPENTIVAIEAAVEAKADWIEFDVRVIANGDLFLFHDADLKRFGGGEVQVATLDRETVEKMDVGSWFDPKFAAERPPTLEQAVEACLEGGTVPLVERKTGPAAAYVKVIRDLGVVDEVVLQAFDWDFLEEVRRLEPKLKLGALKSDPPEEEDWERLRRLRPEWVGWKHENLTADLVRDFQKAGFRVAVWTVNDAKQLREFTKRGVDGLITDRPGPAREEIR